MSVKILEVVPKSPCAKNGIKAGELLLKINDHNISDVLDYQFYASAKKLILLISDESGKQREVKIKKGEYEDLGLNFETYLMDKQHHCENKCIFCFIDQLPKGLRKSLYFKDDDSRLSFLFGNYITLTNLTEQDIDRIIEMRISPVNISIHTMNPELRVKMMKNPKAGKSLGFIKRLAQAEIKLNTQLVLCPGINDGEELKFSLKELAALYPAVQSIAAVPVGLTGHRDGLSPIEPYTAQTAAEVIDIIEDFSEHFLYFNGTRLAYPADEFYLKAGRPIPEESYYEDFAQLENGVGLWALLKSEFYDALEHDKRVLPEKMRKITIATGTAAFGLLQELSARACEKYENLSIQVIPIKNHFFGETVNVAGLVTGGDLKEQLINKELGEELLIPAVMLRNEGDLFLDSMTLNELSEALSIKINPVPNSGDALLRAMLGG